MVTSRVTNRKRNPRDEWFLWRSPQYLLQVQEQRKNSLQFELSLFQEMPQVVYLPRRRGNFDVILTLTPRGRGRIGLKAEGKSKCGALSAASHSAEPKVRQQHNWQSHSDTHDTHSWLTHTRRCRDAAQYAVVCSRVCVFVRQLRSQRRRHPAIRVSRDLSGPRWRTFAVSHRTHK